MNRIVQNGTEICSLAYNAEGRVKSETLAGGHTYVFYYTGTNKGNIVQVDISDSAGPARRVRISPVDYTLDVLAKGEHERIP
jgi:YD repeat-containing protein